MVCDTFKRLSFDTWDKISQGKNVNFQLKEETITDLLMLELKLRHPNEVATYVVPKKEEGEVGADWEWWFTDSTKKWLGLRVQAKIINIENDKFSHLHYRKDNKSLYQCETLIAKANQLPFKTIPIYCFYIHPNDVTLPLSRTGSRELYGCSLLSAFKVNGLRGAKKKNKLSDINTDIIPWHELVCTPIDSSIGVVASIMQFLRNQLNIDPIDGQFIHNNPPTYVIDILVNNQERGLTLETNIGLAGVMVFRDTNSLF